MSQLEYKSENQNFTSNFTFQFIKKIQKTNKSKSKTKQKKNKRNGTLSIRISKPLNFDFVASNLFDN